MGIEITVLTIDLGYGRYLQKLPHRALPLNQSGGRSRHRVSTGHFGTSPVPLHSASLTRAVHLVHNLHNSNPIQPTRPLLPQPSS